jgi:hypothetical protein
MRNRLLFYSSLRHNLTLAYRLPTCSLSQQSVWHWWKADGPLTGERSRKQSLVHAAAEGSAPIADAAAPSTLSFEPTPGSRALSDCNDGPAQVELSTRSRRQKGR